MYSTCIFCNASLGHNEAVERFPVGRRLAFDAARGRLWAACSRCGRWNLSPIDERWEAIEECERLTRSLRARAATDSVALFHAPDGTQLIRLGSARRPEIAAWRYSREYMRRLRRTFVTGVAAASAAAAGAWALGVAATVDLNSFGAAWVVGINAMNLGWFLRRGGPPVPVRGPDGERYLVTRRRLAEVQLVTGDAPDAWGVHLRHSFGYVTLYGDEAARALGRLMTRINAVGARPRAVSEALQLAASGETNRLLRLVAEQSVFVEGEAHRQLRKARRDTRSRRGKPADGGFDFLAVEPTAGRPVENEGALYNLPLRMRLAVEMSLHEEIERRAMENELAPLVAAWREAEEIAGIADSLLTPPSVASALERLTRGRLGTR